MKTLPLASALILLVLPIQMKACTIFCATDSNKTLMAGNEDWSDPFSKIWVHEKSDKNYGVLYLGHSNFQVQFGVNEYGLALDFAAIEKIEGKNLSDKKDLYSDIATTILTKCKSVAEALVYLNNYKYQSPYHQMLLFDAKGASVVVNQDGIVPRTQNYQVTTNFNYCIPEKRSKCQRFEIIDKTLSEKSEITISLFRDLLSRTHQEYDNPTQYSYIVDATEGKLHLYSFHNFENEVVLDYKEVISKGFMMKDLKPMFPDNFMEMDFRTHHKDSLEQALLGRLATEDAKTILTDYEAAVKVDPEVDNYPFLLLNIAHTLINETAIQENQGKPFDYWWYPEEEHMNYKSKNPKLDKALELLTYLENVPKEDPKQNIGTFEFKGLIYSLLDEKEMAKEYFKKTIEVSPKETGNYKRSERFLEYLIKEGD